MMDRWIDEFAEEPRERSDRIGNYLVSRGIIDKYDLKWALKVSAMQKKPLGEVIVDLDLATPIQIQQALEDQRKKQPLN